MAQFGLLGQRRRRRQLNAEVNIINLVDVMLVLLIIFMVTAPIMQSGVQVHLPRADVQPVDIPDAITISIDRSGHIAVGDKSVTFAQLQTSLKVMVAAGHAKSVMVFADSAASVSDMVRVLAVVRQAGVEKVSIGAQPGTDK
ncbi:MAG TPA: biopolymer transporter ExbD [Gemmatimonadales bacterium]|jgi:biopolymer transport protein ExbD|nr:biopolymer transporter ExbD [Gemmatimonadales bacterium]